MHTCNTYDADMVIDDIAYRLDTLAEVKYMGRLRGTAGVAFPDYPSTLLRLEEAHKQALARRRAEQGARPPRPYPGLDVGFPSTTDRLGLLTSCVSAQKRT